MAPNRRARQRRQKAKKTNKNEQPSPRDPSQIVEEEQLTKSLEPHVSVETSKSRILTLIGKTAREIKCDVNNQVLPLLEEVLTVMTYESDKKNLTLQIMQTLGTNLLDYDDDLGILKKNLESKLLPKELRRLVVKGGALDSGGFLFDLIDFGHFGVIVKGTLKTFDKSIKVAIKESVEKCFHEMIINEAKILSQCNHPNIVRILAFEKNKPSFAMEHTGLGNLRDALESYKFTDQRLREILREITSGMEYIATRNYVHRDLRCKNVLLDSGGTCKISEFGLCRYVGDSEGIYEEKTKKTDKFTTKTDVWAMGVFGWEIYFISRGFSPGLISKRELKIRLWTMFRDTGILVNHGCPPQLWAYLRTSLLNKDPEKRPTFTEIRIKLDSQADPE